VTDHILASWCGLDDAPASRHLHEIMMQLELIADLNGADMFIDCLREDGIAVVVAQARPRGVSSNYQKSAVGRVARREDEPAVYLAFESGLPVKDLKAVTQERRNVMQDVAPIRMEDGSCIGVLIAERDVTREVRREQKLRSLETREDAERLEPVPGGGDLVLREMNHRMKNQLQMLSSTIRIRSRSADSGQTRAELLTTAAEVDAIASAYDAMTSSPTEPLLLQPLLEKTAEVLRGLLSGKPLEIRVAGDPVQMTGERAITLISAVSELMVNAIRHGYPGGRGGVIQVTLISGNLVNTIQVEDDGVGFRPETVRKTGGMRLISGLVREKLAGEILWYSDGNGTRVTISIPREQ